MINKKVHNNIGDIMYFLNSFFIYSILGYIFETIGGIITKTNYKSGILHGPWTPIYGIGVVVILLLSNYFFKNLHMPRWKETIIVIIILAVFLTCLETIGGVLIEKTSGIVFWDYSDKKFHIGKYICLEMMLVWAIGSVIFIYFINPILDSIIKKVPLFLTIAMSIVFIIDIIYTICTGIKK